MKHPKINQGETFIGNTNIINGLSEVLSNLKSPRIVEDALDIEGKIIKDNEYRKMRAVFLNESDHKLYNQLQAEQLKKINRGEHAKR